MRFSSSVAPIVLVASLLGALLGTCLLGGCPAETAALCGNGAVEASETESTCCEDTGCAFGACGADGCVDPWTSCGDAGSCAAPYVCGGAAPPSYDCAQCGCANAAACVDGVCLDADVRAQERNDLALASDLDLAEYVRFFTDLAARSELGGTVTVDAYAERIAAAMHEDRRTTTLIIGAEAGAEIATVMGIFEAAIGAPTLEVDRPSDACEATASASTGLFPETFIVAVVDDDDASPITCPYPGTWARCSLPLASQCVDRASRRAVPVVVVDMNIALATADQAMLVRAGIQLPETVDALLGEALSLFQAARSAVVPQDGFVVGQRFAVVFPDVPHESAAESATVGDGAFVVIGAPDAKAYRLGSFRTLWNDTLSQRFMIQNDIQTRDCTFVIDADETVHMTCTNAGAVLDAIVNGANFTLIDVTRTGP